mgnify:CR=1 FL=1
MESARKKRARLARALSERVGVGEAPLRGRGGEGPGRLVELVAVAQAAAAGAQAAAAVGHPAAPYYGPVTKHLTRQGARSEGLSDFSRLSRRVKHRKEWRRESICVGIRMSRKVQSEVSDEASEVVQSSLRLDRVPSPSWLVELTRIQPTWTLFLVSFGESG